MEFQEQCPEFMMLSELDREIVFYFQLEKYFVLLLRAKFFKLLVRKKFPALPFEQRGDQNQSVMVGRTCSSR